ncbi:alpha-L-rhamnosidase [Dysgonomonas sp. Marseille-P4677]|uniref:alpha-L-rhamnosidase-related protein n=1 Tax=Dysgonomonas sp. Marseille-P4677 TaxID=2364790 RepID=UPI00191389DE|nr:alpha-L-rhamnosidase C-terminal domain-containing protein [Dysgonomonas sp. Marseille-P4677]MBK5720283.1 alpha-L-rhamnosidase [Dysgonomonas sp. Marseille-P4677]
MYKTKKTVTRIILICSFVFFTILLQAAKNKPFGLMTDLIEHTDRIWQNGYASNIFVWQTDGAIEALQYAQIRSTHPSLSWIVPGETKGTRQIAYHIILADTYSEAVAGRGTVWDSGLIDSDQSTAVPYWGTELKKDKCYFWRVKCVTNTEGESEWSDVKAFRTASALSDYAATSYPQVKSMEYPISVTAVTTGTYVADFGKDAFSQLLLTLTSLSDTDTVLVHLGECMSGSRVDRNPGGTIRYHSYPLVLLKGTYTYRIKIAKDKQNTRSAAILMPGYVGEVLPFRYCEIEGYASPLLSGAISREHVHYPFDTTASSFQCSNDTLNQIWNMCKYSIQATSFTGMYVDGDRERIPYEADALINQLCHYSVEREYSMARRTHEYLLQYPTWPTEWILQAVLIAWNDYMYTGDSRSLKVNYNILKARTLMQLREKNGMISTTQNLQTPEFLFSINRPGEKIRDIVDWPHTGILGLNKHEGGEADGFVFTDYNTVTNAYHYEALKLMGKIAKALDLKYDASFFEEEANMFLIRFNKMFFNPKLGYYVDGDTTNHASLHANMFPVAFGMVPSGRMNKVMEFIQTRGMACSVYGSQFLMDAIYESGNADYGLHMLTKTDDRGWYNMIRVGSTISLEAWDNKYKPNQDWNHAWGAAPANIIPRKVIGVEPLIPGYGLVRIKPQLGSLKWAKSTIPTIKGKIQLAIENKTEKFSMKVVLPANMEAEVYLPLPFGKYEIYNNGTFVKATKVKGEPFLYVGMITSGTHEITMYIK